MNLLERVLTLLHANLNSVVEKSDDPEQVLRQLQLDMHNQLVQVKTQVATAIAESRKLQKRSQEKTTESDLWLKKAEQAIQQAHDDIARTALSRYNDINKQAQRYKQLQKEQEQLVVTMRGALRQLEAKIAEVETTIDLLITRKRNALLQQRVYDAINKTSMGGPKEQERATKAQDAVLEAEARARALADLHQRDFDTQLESLSSEQIIEQQLNDIKARQRPLRETPLLPEGNPHLSPLLHPQPQSGDPVRKPPTDNTPHAPSSDSPDTKKAYSERLKKLLETLKAPPSQE